jgi:hypothetical protein
MFGYERDDTDEKFRILLHETIVTKELFGMEFGFRFKTQNTVELEK